MKIFFQNKKISGILAILPKKKIFFDDEILKKCGRAHTNKDTLFALSLLNDYEFDNYSIDLISSLPYLSLYICQFSFESSRKHRKNSYNVFLFLTRILPPEKICSP
jgi:hypothetical protein